MAARTVSPKPRVRDKSVRETTDPETGASTVVTEYRLERISTADRDELQAQLRQARRWNESLDDRIADEEKALRAGTWAPPNALEILQLIDRLRRCRGRLPQRAEVVAFCLGWQFCEAEGLLHWPIVEKGRTLSREKSKSAKGRGRQIQEKALATHGRLIKLKGQHDPHVHGALVPWLAKRLGCSEKTVRRHLSGQQRR